MTYPLFLREYDFGRTRLMGAEHGMAYGTREEFDDSVGFRFTHEDGWGDERTYMDDENGKQIRKLMLFTGMVDVKDRRMFDQDICEQANGNRFIIHYSDDNGAWCASSLNDPKELYLHQVPEGYTVIGNIYETPEFATKNRKEDKK